jgi:signal transduction histidine kinase
MIMLRLSDRSSQWIFYLAAGFNFGAVFLRSILVYGNSPDLFPVLGMLLFWLVLFVSESAISAKWSRYFPLYLVIQTGLIFALLGLPDSTDFFAALFVIPSMQIMQRLGSNIWMWGLWIGLCALGTTLLLLKSNGNQAFALVLIFTAASVFYGFYAKATRQAQIARVENLALARELQEANQKLQAYSAQMEQLVVARERNRLARDLHDSVTQTVFSMTLTTQSALLLLEREPDRVATQLDRLSQLARNALSEMQLMISELKPEEVGSEGLVVDLKRYLTGGHFPEDLSIDLEVQGEQSLGLAEEQSLFHVVQEALNNIVKHAQTRKAQVRLHLTEPMWIEIEDQGRGFDLQHAKGDSRRLGLHSMRERAIEIGWDLKIRTSPGSGTCVRVEKLPEEARQA